jgi:prefoldin subunit 5
MSNGRRNFRAGESGEPPSDGAAPITSNAAQARILRDALEQILRETVSELKTEVSTIKTQAHADFKNIIYIFGTGFLLLAGLAIGIYVETDEHLSSAATRLEDHVNTVEKSLVKVETKLDDLLERVPPVPTAIPRK